MMAFYRLAITGVECGDQPFHLGSVHLVCNGEIYNYKELYDKYELNDYRKTDSDCEVILHLYNKLGIEETIALLDGEFAFCLVDQEKHLVHFGRDHMGIKPLYMAGILDHENHKLTSLELASEIKAMNLSSVAAHVYPRTIYTYDMKNFVLSTITYKCLPLVRENHNIVELYELFKAAVIKRISQGDRPIGFLLSGGFDSSLVLSISMEYYHKNKIDIRPKVFTFGFEEKASDVLAAGCMVNFLRGKYGMDCLEWHKVIAPLEDGAKAIPSVIWALETYCTTTIRASTPMWLISRYISKNTDVKVVLSGEGSDELFGGYLYFKYAPNAQAYRTEVIKLLNNIYLYDALRADRSTADHGLEIRPPFLDEAFVSASLEYTKLVESKQVENKLLDDPKMSGLTKKILRYMVKDLDLLPDEILYGRKEAFSDAVGLSWKDYIQSYASKFIEEHNLDEVKYSSHIKPVTSEMKYYQTIFYELFGCNYEVLPCIWLPNQSWIKTGIEPSARVLQCYKTT
jgi:asparagine synthase (glutamine-hydrolysing)